MQYLLLSEIDWIIRFKKFVKTQHFYWNTRFILFYIVTQSNFKKNVKAMCEKYVLDRLNKKTKTYLIFAVEPVRNPDLGPEAPRGVPAGDSIMILEKIIEIQPQLRLQ